MENTVSEELDFEIDVLTSSIQNVVTGEISNTQICKKMDEKDFVFISTKPDKEEEIAFSSFLKKRKKTQPKSIF